MKNKVAVVTGAAQGLGAAFVRKLSSEGAKVVATDIQVEAGKAVVADLGDYVRFLKHDVTSAADWDHVVRETERSFGAVAVLVNNAGIAMKKAIVDTSEAEYRKVIDTNQTSVFLGMRAVIPSMRKTSGGSIINVSSIGGLRGNKGMVGYDSSKFAVRGMTKVAALELGEYGIRVNSVHPGIIETPIIEQGDLANYIAEIVRTQIPLKRIARAEEAANLILFLASDESSYSTGAEFIIDGGMTAG